jgi:hypothetical protein
MTEWASIIAELGGGLSAGVIVALAWAYWAKDKQLAEKDARFIDLALSTQKTLQELTAAIRENRGS